ncbi:MAG: hypothetical protein ACTHUY_04385 [Flaviflexus sp.]|uniref:Uncharacterized protein n=1 Tax=Flaviflexus ciconiae TaxID=2496867 RepID=A0A3Q9G7L8_9ACTO|nr:hypothetical protein [Flaviflexus ciconiae]AZQ77488.1 hypothetical protein EJ997_09225 [Flaviflexus ciconiae]
MASTDVVKSITSVGLVPANRTRDHVQRIFSGLFFGSFIGSMIAILFFDENMTLLGYAVPFIGAFVIAIIGFVLWKLAKGKDVDESVPVVAKVLGTAESVAERSVRTGGILCPVVVRPLEGEDFRSVVLSTSETKEPPKDIAPGTIMALRQVEPGLGDLISAPANDEQRALMERWARNPKLVSNRAPALPTRRGPLERKPASAAIEFYASIGIGAALLFSLVQLV